jgi:hypothetical protein
MSDVKKIITKDSLKEEAEAKKMTGGLYASDPVILAETKLGKNIMKYDQKTAFDLAFSARPLCSGAIPKITGKYGTALAAPCTWIDGKKESVIDRVKRGAFATATNTLLPDWQQLWEMMRIDLTMRKTATPTLRQFVYNMLNRPDADKTNKVIDFLPWDVTFEEVTGNGDAVRQGKREGAITDTFDVKIYGAGFVWTLLAALFDKQLDLTQMNDAVILGYNSLQDHLAFSEITGYSYGAAGTAKHTAADATGTDKYEKLYLTLENAIEDLAKRMHPVITTKHIQANELIYLGSTNSCRHVAKVVGGFRSVTDNRPYPELTEISQIIAYDGESTKGYDGIGDTYGYLVKRNEFMNIIIKRGLTAEIDLQPDVKTLAQEERAWWFAEGVYAGGDYGVGSFIQKITLPTW